MKMILVNISRFLISAIGAAFIGFVAGAFSFTNAFDTADSALLARFFSVSIFFCSLFSYLLWRVWGRSGYIIAGAVTGLLLLYIYFMIIVYSAISSFGY